MNALARNLGLSPTLEFRDVYSLTDPTILSTIPRPAHALLVILPLTAAWHRDRVSEDSDKPAYAGKGEQEPVLWFKQTIGHACGSIGLLHCLVNGEAKSHIKSGSTLAKLREQAIPLGTAERAQLLYDSKEFEAAHQSAAEMGDTVVPSVAEEELLGQHFVAFVKEGGRLWELEGSRKGPLDRGALTESEDVLSERGLKLGLERVIKMEAESGGGDLRFSCIALTGRE